MKFYYFYILRSERNGKLYLGSTADLKKRLKQHNGGTEKATKPNTPYELIHYQAFKNKREAVVCEKYFKTTAGWKRLKAMLKTTLENY